MLENDQYTKLLEKDTIESVTSYLGKFGLKNFRLVAPYVQSDKNKINILAKESAELDYHVSATINLELEKIFGEDQVFLHLEGDEDDNNLRAYNSTAIPFTRESIEKAYNEQYPKNYKVEVNEDDTNVTVVITLKKKPGLNYNKGDVESVYKITTEENFDPSHTKQHTQDGSRLSIKAN